MNTPQQNIEKRNEGMNEGMNKETKKSIIAILDDFRFKVYPREEYDKAKLYRYLGVEQYLWLYMNTIGRTFGMIGKNIDDKNLYSIRNIERHIQGSKLYEIIHMTFLSLGLILNGNDNYSNNFIITQALVNIYPILLQRYKRARLNKVAQYRKAKNH